MCKSWRHLQLRQQLLLPQGHSTCVKSISIPIYLIIKQKFAVQFHQHLPNSSFWVRTEFLPSFPAHRTAFSFPPFSMPFSKVTSSRENITWITPTSAYDRAVTFCHHMHFAAYLKKKRGVEIHKNSNSIHTDIYCGIPAIKKTPPFQALCTGKHSWNWSSSFSSPTRDLQNQLRPWYHWNVFIMKIKYLRSCTIMEFRRQSDNFALKLIV